MPSKVCSAPSCPKPVLAKGLCSSHYRRQRRGGSVETPVVTRAEGTRQVAPVYVSELCAVALMLEAARVNTSVYATIRRVLETANYLVPVAKISGPAPILLPPVRVATNRYANYAEAKDLLETWARGLTSAIGP